MDLVLKYLKQPSTWRGIAMLLGFVGISISPEHLIELGAAVGGAFGVIEVIRDELKEKE